MFSALKPWQWDSFVDTSKSKDNVKQEDENYFEASFNFFLIAPTTSFKEQRKCVSIYTIYAIVFILKYLSIHFFYVFVLKSKCAFSFFVKRYITCHCCEIQGLQTSRFI